MNLADSNRNATGVLTSHPDSKDIKIESFSLTFYSQVLIQETNIELNFGRRYGLIGANGSGKSTFLQCLANREVPIPEHMDIHLLNGEYPPTEMTAVEAVIHDAQKELEVCLVLNAASGTKDGGTYGRESRLTAVGRPV